MGKGIDYGMGTTNIDRATGIRYGVIPMNDLNEFAYDSFEDDYGAATCPVCGNEVQDVSDVEKELDDVPNYRERGSCDDYYCDECNHTLDSQDCFGEEPIGSHLDDGEYLAELHSDGDVFVLRSPYYTRAAFCSPCAPGACYLTDPQDDGAKAYCFGPDWFTDDKPPYPVYRVSDDSLVFKPE